MQNRTASSWQCATQYQLEWIGKVEAKRTIIAGLLDALGFVANRHRAPNGLGERNANLTDKRNIRRPIIQSSAPGRIVARRGRDEIIGIAVEDAV